MLLPPSGLGGVFMTGGGCPEVWLLLVVVIAWAASSCR
jgi:hypothetical protein